jgi:hypothetical protein
VRAPRSQRRSARAAIRGVSFDDLIGEIEDRLGDRQGEFSRGLEVDDQLECCRLLDRQVGGLGALEDLIDKGRRPPLSRGKARRIR